MKSVISQGVSTAKAIELALQKAGTPEEFFVKVLEEAQSGFLGFGSKKAKIALFFKKEDLGDTDELLSQRSYEHLFNNKSLNKQIVDQGEIVKPVIDRKKDSKPSSQSPRRGSRRVTGRAVDKPESPRGTSPKKRKVFSKPISNEVVKSDIKKAEKSSFLLNPEKKDLGSTSKKLINSRVAPKKKAIVENKKAMVDKPEREYKSSFDNTTGESRWKIRSTSSKKTDGTKK